MYHIIIAIEVNKETSKIKLHSSSCFIYLRTWNWFSQLSNVRVGNHVVKVGIIKMEIAFVCRTVPINSSTTWVHGTSLSTIIH